MSNDWEAKKLEHDRDIEFWVDPMDIDETNLTLSVANIQNTFETEQAIPEKDSYRYSKLHTLSLIHIFGSGIGVMVMRWNRCTNRTKSMQISISFGPVNVRREWRCVRSILDFRDL